jgi:hypothetical protein
MRLVQDFDKIRNPETLGGWLSTAMRRECIRSVDRQRGEVLTGEWRSGELAHTPSADIVVLTAERKLACGRR